MDTVPTLLFGRNKLFREGLKSLLKGSQFNVVGEADDVGMMDLAEDLELGLILIDLSSNPVHIVEDLHHLASVFPDAPVVILNDNLCSNTLASCLAAGAAGYLMKDISLDALLISLQLVVLGEKVFPTHLAALLVNGVANTVPANIPPDNSFGLSEREMQILQCLVQGDFEQADRQPPEHHGGDRQGPHEEPAAEDQRQQPHASRHLGAQQRPAAQRRAGAVEFRFHIVITIVVSNGDAAAFGGARALPTRASPDRDFALRRLCPGPPGAAAFFRPRLVARHPLAQWRPPLARVSSRTDFPETAAGRNRPPARGRRVGPAAAQGCCTSMP